MSAEMDSHLCEILYTEENIEHRVQELADQITRDYPDESKELVVVGILTGAVMFFVDLTKRIKRPITMEFMQASSYGSETTSSGNVKIIKDLNHSIEGKDVLIVEDIIDTGNTLFNLVNILKKRNPRSLKLVCLLDKKARRVVHIEADYVGFDCDDKFVVGYGLDFNQDYRNLPYIGVVKPELYS